ncbi:MAG: phospholipase D family nuclease, partial [Acidiferrobacteraceae bacterium]
QPGDPDLLDPGQPPLRAHRPSALGPEGIKAHPFHHPSRVAVTGVAALLLAAFAVSGAPPPASVTVHSAAIVAFSPRGGATRLVEAAIAKAHRSIDVQAYSFTSTPIARALLRAHGRGVRVRVVLDRQSVRRHYRAVYLLAAANIPLWEDDAVRIAHSKVMIIDRRAILTGSFNFTFAAAADNSENVLWIRNAPELARAYERDFSWRLGLSRPLDSAARGAH